MTDDGPPSSTAWYVYGIVPPTVAHDPPLELIAEGDVAALARVVPAEDFDEEALKQHLNERDWLERTAWDHERVLDNILTSSPVIPFRLCTIYESREHLRRFLAARRTVFARLLRELDDRVELGVKAYFDPTRFGGLPERDEAETGRDYLRRRQRERALVEEAATFKSECARASHERLMAASEDARANRPQSPELTGRTDEMLLNGAYLVRRGDTRLREAVAELESVYGPRGVTYETTGPWPPYNFVPGEIAEP